MRVDGLREVQAKLVNLDAKVAKSIVRKGLRAGAKIVLGAARADSPRATGALAGKIKILGGRSKKGVTSLNVGIRGTKLESRKHDPAYYARFVMFGHFTGKRLAKKTYEHGTAKAEYHAESLAKGRKFVPGKDFLATAYESSKEAAVAAVAEELTRLIDEEVKI